MSASLSPGKGDDGLSVTLRHDVASNWWQRRLQARRPALVPLPMPPPLLPPLPPLQGGPLSDHRRRSFVLESASSSGGESATGGGRLRDICEEGDSPSAAPGVSAIAHGGVAADDAASSAQSHVPVAAIAAADDTGAQDPREPPPGIDTAAAFGSRHGDAHGHGHGRTDSVGVRESSSRDGLPSPFTAPAQRGRTSSSLEGPRSSRSIAHFGSGAHDGHPGVPAALDDASSPTSRATAMGPMGHHQGPWPMMSDDTCGLSGDLSPTTSLAVRLLPPTTGRLLVWGSSTM